MHGQKKNYLLEALKIKAQADSFYYKSNYEKAQKLYSHLRQIYLQNQDFGRYIDVFYWSGSAYYDAGFYQKATQTMQTGLQEIKRLELFKADTSIFRLNASMAEQYRMAGKLDSSKIFFEKNDKFLDQNSLLRQRIPLELFAFYNNYGLFYKNLGGWQYECFLAMVEGCIEGLAITG